MISMTLLFLGLPPGLPSGIAILLGAPVLYLLLFAFIKRRARKEHHVFPQLLQKYIYLPGLLLVISFALLADFSLVERYLYASLAQFVRHALYILVIISFAWLIMRGFTVFRELALRRYKEENPTDFTPRRAKTKFVLIQRLLNFMIVVAAVAAVLMTFDSVRQVGSTLLASAGVVGIVLGFAAQKSLGTLFAGIQIAIAQPIRLNDVVVVEDQFGTIGEITLTYVVVHTWDGRRLMVPINYFLENSFENWTRVTPEVVGKVKIRADYSLPVDEVRKEFKRWLETSELWDGQKSGFLVTGADERTIEVRATMSARNSDDAWDLECQIREKLITYIRENHPYALPRARVELEREIQNDSNNKN